MTKYSLNDSANKNKLLAGFYIKCQLLTQEMLAFPGQVGGIPFQTRKGAFGEHHRKRDNVLKKERIDTLFHQPGEKLVFVSKYRR